MIITISIFLLFQQSIYAQVSTQKNSSTKFNKYQLSNLKSFKPGDGILINTFPDTLSFLNDTFPIDDMGFVDFPIVGKVSVSSMTTKELSIFIKNKFQQYIRTPNISIKPLLRISLIGGFTSPGLFYVDQSSSVWEAVRRAGGPTFETGLENMVWSRNGEEVVDNILPYFEKGISLKNMGFKSGDQLWTPSSNETFWDDFRTDVIPLLSFAVTIFTIYLTYQQQQILIQTLR